MDAQRERRQRIRDRAAAEGFVRAAELAADFGVSVMTVHRDLDALQTQGWLRKVRGGATALSSAAFHGDVHERMATMAEAKKRLAEAALGMVAPGQTVMLDDSTTCLRLAERLAERAPLTVISNFLPVIELLAREPDVSLVGLGGTFFPAYDAFLGLHTAESVSAFRADVLFMSTTAITRGRCYHQSQETVHVKRALIESAARRVLLADHTKFTREGLHALAPLTVFDLVLVDGGLPPEERRRVRDLGVPLTVVSER